MNWKKRLITYAALAAVALVVVLLIVGLGSGDGTAARLMSASDGCFTVAVLYIGCSVLMVVQEAGNFYGIQFLFHTLAQQFSPRKSGEARKSYYLYCQEKKERQAAEGKSPLKSAMFLVGLICLLFSLGLAALYYRQM